MAGSIYVDPLVQQLAQQASGLCGLDPNVILAQWQCEQGVGSTSTWFYNNPAGLTPGTPQADALSNGQQGGFLTFPTPAAGAQAYAYFYLYGGAYAGVRTAIATGNVVTEMQAIAASGWDATGHYADGASLFAVYTALTGVAIPATDRIIGAAGPTLNETAPLAPSSANAPANQVQFPASNYSVVANSQRTGNIIFGRKWRVVVQTQLGLTLDVSDLRVTFDIKYVLNQQPPFCTVVIFNLNPATEDIFLNYGDQITVEAGYEGTQYGLIFSGSIVEPIRSMQDNVTYLLTLNCLQADVAANEAFAAFTVSKGQSARSMVQNLATMASVPTPIGELSPQLSTAPMPRGKTVFGLTRDYLRQIAQGNRLALHFTDGTINMLGAGDSPPSGASIVDLTPTSGLISIPAQNGLGVNFDALLNPALRIGAYVHIDNSLITAQTFGIGTGIQRGLDAAGIYRIMSVEHIGDSRGAQWLSRCQTVSQAGGIPGMLSTTTGNPYP